MKKKKILGLLGMFLAFGIALTSCEDVNLNLPSNNTNTDTTNGNTTNTDTTSSDETNVTGDTEVTEKTETAEEVTIPEVEDNTNSLSIVVDENDTLGLGEFIQNGNIYTITKAGEYTISGDLAEGSIVVDAADAEVLINLNGVNIKSRTTSPINIIAADKVEISAKKDTLNYITDDREEASDTVPTAAIYAESDLKIKGKGELYIYGNYNNGIHSKDDLDIKNLTLYVNALNNAIKGNDSVTIDTANVVAISKGGDGIKTTNSDISSKGNQRGTITITGLSTVDVYACCDGIDAAYNVEIIADSEGNEPIVNVYTNTYSSYSNETPTTISSSNILYLKLSSSYYSSYYDYYLYCYDTSDKENGEWVKLTYYTQTSSGMGFGGRSSSTYYYLKSSIDLNEYNGVQVYMFTTGTTPFLDNYYAASTGQSINTTKDMLTVTSISSSSKKIGVDWGNYSTTSSSSMPGGMGGMMDQGNTDKTSYSTKGIKADNEVNISAGSIIIKSYDDGIHATSNVTLENGNLSTGNVNINGGNITILSKDDGIHADNILTISNGSITITSAYEGLEGNKVVISGGNHYVYGTDDGINAQSQINVTGGKIAVLVASGDTDAIDSNGTYVQSGGTVISMNMAASGTASVLDCDSKAQITGGIFLAFGNVETTPSLSNVKSTTKSLSMSSGNYNLSYNGEVVATFTLKTNYSRIYLVGASGTYTLGSTSISL